MVYILREIPLESICKHGSSAGTDLDAAGLSQLGHGAHPGVSDAKISALFRDGLGNGRVGVFRQEYLFCTAGIHSFSELFRPYYHFSLRKSSKSPDFGILQSFLVSIQNLIINIFFKLSTKIRRKMAQIFV